MTLQEIITRLEHRNLRAVSKHSGVSYPALYNIARGKTPTPTKRTTDKLIAYLNENP